MNYIRTLGLQRLRTAWECGQTLYNTVSSNWWGEMGCQSYESDGLSEEFRGYLPVLWWLTKQSGCDYEFMTKVFLHFICDLWEVRFAAACFGTTLEDAPPRSLFVVTVQRATSFKRSVRLSYLFYTAKCTAQQVPALGLKHHNCSHLTLSDLFGFVRCIMMS